MSVLREVLVSYDIENNKSRKKIHDSLLDLGLHSIQNSVMFGRLNNAEIKAMERILEKYVDKNTDRSLYLVGLFSKDLKNQSIGYGDNSIFEDKEFEII
jgi:CRISPR-associated protein Cas2